MLFRSTGKEVNFVQNARYIRLLDLREDIWDPVLSITVFELEFEKEPEYARGFLYPQLHMGRTYAEKREALERSLHDA